MDYSCAEMEMMCTRFSVIKLLYMALLVAIRHKAQLVTFSCKSGDEHTTIMLDGKDEMAPLPGAWMFPHFIRILRRMGRYADKSPLSVFSVAHLRTTRGETLDLTVRYDAFHDPAYELLLLMQRAVAFEEIRERVRGKKRSQLIWRKFWTAAGFVTGIIIAVGIVAIASLSIFR